MFWFLTNSKLVGNLMLIGGICLPHPGSFSTGVLNAEVGWGWRGQCNNNYHIAAQPTPYSCITNGHIH